MKVKATENLKFLHQFKPMLDKSKNYIQDLKENIETARDVMKNSKNKNSSVSSISADSNDILSSKASLAVIADILKNSLGNNDRSKELIKQIKQALQENAKKKNNLSEIESKVKNNSSNLHKHKTQKRVQK